VTDEVPVSPVEALACLARLGLDPRRLARGPAGQGRAKAWQVGKFPAGFDRDLPGVAGSRLRDAPEVRPATRRGLTQGEPEVGQEG
jgi:hypothetical protein